jgi:RHS repeat-associated protein
MKGHIMFKRNAIIGYLQNSGRKLLVFMTIEMLLLASIPIKGYSEEINTNGNYLYLLSGKDILIQKNEDLPLIVNYAVDKKNNRINLNWNKKNDGKNRYYVLKRLKDKAAYQIASNVRGIKENYFAMNLDYAQNGNFIICSSEIPIKENLTFAKLFGDVKNKKELEKNIDISIISNEITIDINNDVKPSQIVFQNYAKDKKEVKLSWGTRDGDVSNYLVFRKSKNNSYYGVEKEQSFTDVKYTANEEVRYYVWAFNKNGNASTPMVYQENFASADNENDGFFRINDTGKTVINYEGLKIEIPEGSVAKGSYINITSLGTADIKAIPDGMPDLTYSADGSLKGYDITLNGDASNKFGKDVTVSIKYDDGKMPKFLNEDSVYAFYYDESTKAWQHVKRSALDKTSNTVTGTTNHFCQFYAGMMSIASEPPQAKGINTTPVNIATVDPMAGIKGINPPSPNNRGSANVSYPIEVPAGINGLTPSVSINYSSDAREGNCGYGWNLGVSNITIDTSKGVPKYDNSSDVLLLDGKKLVKTGTEGSNTVYRYKNEGAFSKIVKQGTGNGVSFIVYQTDGTKVYYGETDTTKLYNPDPAKNSQIFTWFISRIVDKFGNQMTYSYTSEIDSVSGKRVNLNLSVISYGYNNGISYAYTLNFDWLPKNAVDITYFSIPGFTVKGNKYLDKIRINYNGSTELKRHVFVYDNTGTFDKLLLKSAKESLMNGSQEIVLNENDFNYNININSNTFTRLLPWTQPDTSWSGYQLQMADINGDGKADLIWNHLENTNDTIVALSNGDGTFTRQEPWVQPDTGWAGYQLRIADIDGDGKADLIWNHLENTNDTIVALSNGDGTFTRLASWTQPDTSWSGYQLQMADINGDGKADLIWNHLENTNDTIVALSKGDGTFTRLSSWTQPDTGWSGYQLRIADINGDGKADLIWNHLENTNDTIVALSNGDGTFTRLLSWTQPDTSWSGYQLQMADINGDGKADLIWNYLGNNNYTIVALSNGDGTFTRQEPWVQPDTGWSGYQLRIADIDGDGKADLIWNYLGNNNHIITGLSHSDGLSPNKNLINTITNSRTGLSTLLTYQKVFTDPNHLTTHFNMEKVVLSSVTTGNSDLSLTTNIDYSNGIYDNLNREFRGFQTVSTTVFDSVKNVSNITETTYHVSDNSGQDSCNNWIYDQYLNGHVDTVTKKLVKSNGSIQKLGKQQTLYSNPTGVLTSFPDVKLVIPIKTKNWIYDLTGGYIGKNPETDGDVVSETKLTDLDIDTTNGLINSSTSWSYGDPYNTGDDVKTVSVNTNNVANWLSLPSTVGAYDIDGKLLSDKAIGYNSIGATSSMSVYEIVGNNTLGTPAVTSFTYDGNGETATSIGPDGITISFTNNYPSSSSIYKECTKTMPNNPGNLTEISRYDIYGRLVESVDTYGDTTDVVYDNYGRIIKVYEQDDPRPTPVTTSTAIPTDNSDLPSKIFIYETEGSYFKVTAMYKDSAPDVNHYLSAQFYKDGLGRSVQSKAQYEVNGTKEWVVSGITQYDSMGRAVQTDNDVTTADFATTGFISKTMGTNYSSVTYNDLSMQQTVTTPSYGTLGALTTTTSYSMAVDNNNRILSKTTVSDTAGHVSSIYKDMAGAEVKTETQKNAAGDLITSSMNYNLLGYATMDECAGYGLTGEKQYDSFGRLKWIKSPDAGRKEYFYNAKGLVEKIWDYGKTGYPGTYRETTFVYDSLNRITNINHTGSTDCNITYTYYPTTETLKYRRGNIQSVTKGSNFSVTYDYTQYSITETKTIDGTSYATTYEYDIQGRIKNLTYPDGEAVTYAYNEGGMLKSITGSKGGVTQVYIDQIKYNEYGRRIYVKYGNGTEQNYTYDAKTRLLGNYQTVKGTNTYLSYVYSFDRSGNVTNVNEGNKTVQSYEYDLLGRLTKGTGGYTPNGSKYYSELYAYDDVNRMTSKTDGMTTYSYNYLSGTHAASSIAITGTGINKRIDFQYDDYGKMTGRNNYDNSVLSSSESYTYNAGDELSNINLGEYKLDLEYDAGGQRTRKTYTETATSILMSDLVYVSGYYTVDEKNATVNKHISDGNFVIATKVGNDNANTLYYHQNHIGSTAMLTDSAGAVFQNVYYKPYGETWVVEGTPSDAVTRLFTSQEYDAETGMYYYNARYYDPALAMFICPDPAMQGANHYAYCGCNPVMYSDPTGCWNNDYGLEAILATIVSFVANIVNWCQGKSGWVYNSTLTGACALLAQACNVQTNPALNDPSNTASSQTIGGGSAGSGSGTGSSNTGSRTETDEKESDPSETTTSSLCESLIKTWLTEGLLTMKITDRVINLINEDDAFRSFEDKLISKIMNGEIESGYTDSETIPLGGIEYSVKNSGGLKGLINEYNKSFAYYFKTGDKTTYRFTNELFYMLRNTTITYKVYINTDKSFSIKYSFNEPFDLRSHKGNSNFSESYNRNIEKLGHIWHDLWGISDQASHKGSWINYFNNNGLFINFYNIFR